MSIYSILESGEYFVKIGDNWTYAYYSKKYNDWYSEEDDWYYINEEILEIDLTKRIKWPDENT